MANNQFELKSETNLGGISALGGCCFIAFRSTGLSAAIFFSHTQKRISAAIPATARSQYLCFIDAFSAIPWLNLQCGSLCV
jgi:hypothetical protein